MAKTKDTTTEAHERPGAIVEALREAGVDRELTMRVFSCIETERATAIAKAARLFYNADEDDPITPGQFDDELNNMTRRMWGVVAAVEGALDGKDDSVGQGVLQLVNDPAQEMERLAEAFDAEQWLAKEPA
ncbi:hypothetical protein [Methylocystis sp.]|uniref:hypothetical protein n=1 Tax=Methylocystis sp. TaxID=1911079 RepID=UPI0025E88989|nr:hypothetical protein [Methylocystis sp.]